MLEEKFLNQEKYLMGEGISHLKIKLLSNIIVNIVNLLIRKESNKKYVHQKMIEKIHQKKVKK
jgi:hypothetical protein